MLRHTLPWSLHRNTTTITGGIPMAQVPWYELNNPGDSVDSGSIGLLFDGNINKQISVGFGKVNPVDNFIFELYKCYDNINISTIRLYQYEGSGTNPTIIYGMTDFDATPTILASFTGSGFEQWYTYNVTASAVKYLKILIGDIIPGQMEVSGTYSIGNYATSYNLKSIPFSNMVGANMFEWQILNNDGSGVNSTYLTAMETFSQVRHYLDWDKLEHVQGQYTFSPASSGAWDYDLMYNALHSASFTVLSCIKAQPAWMESEYPTGSQDNENAPVNYVSGTQANKLLTGSYTDYGKLFYQFAGRYGSNTLLDTSSLHPYTQPKQFGQSGSDNVIQVGLGTVNYIEINNETDRWWKGLLSYQSAYEYAVNLSVCYDGHLNTMGTGIGIKNADPNMPVVMSGFAGTVPDYIRGIVDWSKTNRGYKLNGKINVPFDIINYHYYANNNTSGICPESSSLAQSAISILQEGQYLNIPVWLTETGYDDTTGSPICAISIGSKSIADVKADWTLRTSLLCARIGINRVFFYEAYDDVPGNPTIYATSGLLDGAQTTLRKPAGDFLYQAKNLLNGYSFKSSSTTSGIIIDVYNNGTKDAYVLFSPTQTGASVSYTLAISNAVHVYQPLKASQTMTSLGTSKNLTVTETPIFVILD